MRQTEAQEQPGTGAVLDAKLLKLCHTSYTLSHLDIIRGLVNIAILIVIPEDTHISDLELIS